jgi:hypothetical protein
MGRYLRQQVVLFRFAAKCRKFLPIAAASILALGRTLSPLAQAFIDCARAIAKPLAKR